MEFIKRHVWDFHKGYYNEGQTQYMVTFEYVDTISTFCNHYYRFHRFSDSSNTICWLKLNCIQYFRFLCIQNGILKTIVSFFLDIVKFIISLFK